MSENPVVMKTDKLDYEVHSLLGLRMFALSLVKYTD